MTHTEKGGNGQQFTLEWVSGVNAKGEPFIQLAKVYESKRRELVAQLDPWQTRDCALNALSAAEAAQTDAFLMAYMKEKFGLDLPAVAAFIAEFRDFRSKLGTSDPTPIEHWNEVIDHMAKSKTGRPFDPTKKQ